MMSDDMLSQDEIDALPGDLLNPKKKWKSEKRLT